MRGDRGGMLDVLSLMAVRGIASNTHNVTSYGIGVWGQVHVALNGTRLIKCADNIFGGSKG